MRFLIIVGFTFFTACAILTQPKTEMVRINTMSVFKDFQERGYTTAGALTHFEDLRKNNNTQLIIDNESKKMLELILMRAEKKKHHQTKHGSNLIFCELRFDTDTTCNKVIISEIDIVYNMFRNAKEERAFITDLTKMINYKIVNPTDLKWLSDFSQRIRSS